MLCEKTMEISVDRCQAMIAAARDAKVQLAIAYRCQFEPHHLECVRLARDGTFGRLLSVEAGFGFPIGGSDQWRLDRERSGRGPLMDVGIYAELDQFGAELDDFADCIRSGRPTRVPGEEGLRDVRIMLAAYESARTGAAVRGSCLPSAESRPPTGRVRPQRFVRPPPDLHSCRRDTGTGRGSVP